MIFMLRDLRQLKINKFIVVSIGDAFLIFIMIKGRGLVRVSDHAAALVRRQIRVYRYLRVIQVDRQAAYLKATSKNLG